MWRIKQEPRLCKATQVREQRNKGGNTEGLGMSEEKLLRCEPVMGKPKEQRRAQIVEL